MAAKDAATRLSAARTRLVLDKPFLGALAMRLPLVEGNPAWCRTTATDARSFYYNRRYIEALSQSEVEFMVAHEALHCALSHFARRQHRVKRRWDIACDLAINPLLIEEGLKAPPGALLLDQFKGMAAEEIYPCLEDKDDGEEPLDQHLYDGPDGGSPEASPGAGGGASGGGAPPRPLSPQERQSLDQQWKQRLASAAQAAMSAGKLKGALARLVQQLEKPHLNWRVLLAHHLALTAREDHSYLRPSRREGPAILPNLRSHEADILAVLDTSGSIADGEMRDFLAEINAIKGQLHARVTLLACDTALAEGCPWVFEPWETLTLPASIKGGGGTDFRPPFQWIEGQDLHPGVVVYFTDAKGAFPRAAPPCPVVWLVKGHAPVPWGNRVQLN